MNKLLTLGLLSIASNIAIAADAKLINPKLTEVWDPVPPVVTPNKIPSDAIVLFDGSNSDKWQSKGGKPISWTIDTKEKTLTVKPKSKSISTIDGFCDMQLHIEWRTPKNAVDKKGQQSGNSGIFIQGRYEIQVLNSYENVTYSNGQAGAVYKQAAPLVNASLPPFTWQTYDIIYQAPKFDQQGNVSKKAHITVLHNGVLIQNNTEIQGPTVFRGQPKYKAHGCAPISLQDHGNTTSFRNIWVRKL